MTSSTAWSDLMFAQVREDPRLDLEVARAVAARAGRPLRVLLIASGGCSALSLLAEGGEAIAEVHAVDLNPAQLHLTALRRAAVTTLPEAAARQLVGAAPATTAERLALYDRVRPQLHAAARAHWDARPHEVGAGVNGVGRFEALFRDLARALAAAGIDAVAHPDQAASHPAWRPTFQRVFERSHLAALFGEAAVAYSMDRSFADHFEAVFASALARFRVADNYFLSQVLTDGYPTDPALGPAYLGAGAGAALARRPAAALQLHQGALADWLAGPAAAHAPFDLIQTSNVSDWMPLDALDALLLSARRVLAPHGAVLCRRLNGDHVLADRVARHFMVDTALSGRLLAADRSFFYREVVAGFAGGDP